MGILDDWIDTAFDASSDEYKNNPDLRITALCLLADIWRIVPQKIED
jgi:hypothetical protein